MLQWALAILYRKNLTENSSTKYNFTNFFPRASYNYKFKPNQNLRLNYNGSTSAPSLEQLQPIRVNTDPLNIYIGNPDLKQSFRHSINAGYNSYNVLKEKNLYTNINIGFVQNSFVQSSTVDSVGKRTYQTVNTSGPYNINIYSDYGRKLTKWKIRVGAGPVINMSKNIDYINGIKNITKNTNYGVRFNVSKYVENKYDFYFSPGITRTSSEASVNKSANADYWQLEGWANARVKLPKGFEVTSDANIQWRQKDPRFTNNNNFTNWNAALVRRMLKDNKLEVRIGIYDILNQNKGYQRNFSSYSFTESYYTTLRRFWLVSVTWNISKNGKPASF